MELKTQIDKNRVIIGEGLPALVKIPDHELTVERMTTMEALVQAVELYGITHDRYMKSIEILKHCLSDEDGEHLRADNGGKMTWADRKIRALQIVTYLETANQFSLDKEILLQIGLAFYVVEGYEQPSDSPSKLYTYKSGLLKNNIDVWLFFCEVGMSYIRKFKNIEPDKMQGYLTINEAVMLPFSRLFMQQTHKE